MKKKKQGTFAAIHVGSEMISLQIVEYSDLDNLNISEFDDFWKSKKKLGTKINIRKL